MLRRTFALVSLLFCYAANCQQTIHGIGRDGLQPELDIERQGAGDLYIQINYKVLTNTPRNTWLMISNKVGSKLAMWQTNGEALPLIDPSAKAAYDLPVESTVKQATLGINRRFRPQQWWGGPEETLRTQKVVAATGFRLKTCFGVVFTNDVVLSVNPLMYHVSPNHETVHLVEFPTIRIALGKDGTIQQLK